jgi:hypothetical protein
MMSSDCIQHMRFDQIDERETGTNVVRELNDRPKNLGPESVGYLRPATHDRSVALGIDRYREASVKL